MRTLVNIYSDDDDDLAVSVTIYPDLDRVSIKIGTVGIHASPLKIARLAADLTRVAADLAESESDCLEPESINHPMLQLFLRSE